MDNSVETFTFHDKYDVEAIKNLLSVYLKDISSKQIMI